MTYETISLEFSDTVATLTIQRPKALNALNAQVFTELDSALDELKASAARVLLLRGAGGKAFVAGADIKEMVDMDSQQSEQLSKRGQGVFNKLSKLPQATVAVVEGFALGGGFELALSCDFIVASKKATFGLPEVTLGLIPGYGGTQRLTRAVGAYNARRVILSGEMFSAKALRKMGAVSDVVDPDELEEFVAGLAKNLSLRGPVAVQLAKQAVMDGAHLQLNEALELEQQLFGKCFATADKAEGVQAFIEKRKPIFTGK